MATDNCNSFQDPPETQINKLGGDLLTDILIRVPEPRSRCHSKLVCKQWNSLISHPNFVRRFDSHHRSGELDSETPLVPRDSVLSFIPVPSVELGEAFKIFHSFKELLLCGFGCQRDNSELERSYLVCNLFSKQWISLPVAPEKPRDSQITVSRLVCEPRSNNSGNNSDSLDRGSYHGEACEYRFRVVRIYHNIDYQQVHSVRLDVFCSESGEWIKKSLVLEGQSTIVDNYVCSCNGKLFWSNYVKLKDFGVDRRVVAFDPFRLDMPPTFIDIPSALLPCKRWWNLSVSQDTVLVVVFECMPQLGCSRNLSTVLRLEEDRKSWSIQHQGLLNTSRFKDFHKYCYHSHHLHPEKSEIVFLEFRRTTYCSRDTLFVILSCNLRSGEIEYFSNVAQYATFWTVFKPKISCWPTPIPRYKELRTMYDGSYVWLAQSSNYKARTHFPSYLVNDPWLVLRAPDVWRTTKQLVAKHLHKKPTVTGLSLQVNL